MFQDTKEGEKRKGLVNGCLSGEETGSGAEKGRLMEKKLPKGPKQPPVEMHETIMKNVRFERRQVVV